METEPAFEIVLIFSLSRWMLHEISATTMSIKL